MVNTKGDIVNNALRRIKISGLTSKPSAEELHEGLEELEGMMQEFKSRNICTSYAYEGTPEANTNSNLKPDFLTAIQSNLAVRLAMYYGKEVPVYLAGLARGSLSSMSAVTSKTNQILPPSRMPKGSGNTFRGQTWNRYYRCKPNAPIDCDTVELALKDTYDYTISWDNWLSDGASVTAYTIDVSAGLTLVSSQLQGNEVYFKVTGLTVGTQTVKIQITSSDAGRVDNRVVYFDVVESKTA